VETSTPTATPTTTALADTDGDGLSDVDEATAGTDPNLPDTDGDMMSDQVEVQVQLTDPLAADEQDGAGGGANGILDGIDLLCGSLLTLDNGASSLGDDRTNPSAAIGDCDADGDDDGRADLDEINGIGCGGVVTEVSADRSYSDGDPPSWDTDGDAVRDGVECALGTDPTDPGSSPTDQQCRNGLPVDTDSDTDGILDDWEQCKWGSAVDATDSDGDGASDCFEAMDTNGNGFLTPADAVLVLRVVFALGDGDFAAMDINGNGFLTSADGTLIMRAVFSIAPCA
jgi:hypothetical protein